jgi:multiple sugar transport system substrate-binding protein
VYTAALTLPGALVAACAGGDTSGAGEAPRALSRSARISVIFPQGPPEQQQLNASKSTALREKFPTIEVENIMGNAEKVLALNAAGTPPDVYTLNPALGIAGGPDDLATRGAVLKLDDRIKQEKALRWDDVWPAARTAGQLRGAQFTMPTNGLNVAIWYFNKEILASNGRSTPDALAQRNQWTWDTVLDEATRLTKRGAAGELEQAGLGYPWFPRIWITMLLRAYGADYMNKDRTRVVIDSPQATQALRVAWELGGGRRKALVLRGEGNLQELVRTGKVAQAAYWTAAASWWRTVPFDWDVAPPPFGPAGRSMAGLSTQLGISRDTKEPDAAWQYIATSLAPEFELGLAVGFGAMTLRQSSLAQWRQHMAGQKPRNLAAAEEVVKTLRLDPLVTVVPQLSEVDAIYQREIEALFYDGKPPERVVSAVATEGNTLLGVK